MVSLINGTKENFFFASFPNSKCKSPGLHDRHLKEQDFFKCSSVLEASVVSGSCVRLPSGGRAIGLAFVFALAAEHAADSCCPTGPLH